MPRQRNDLRECVYMIVAAIPRGKVMAYSDIAALCSHPRAARQIGRIAHYGPEHLPWHRVVHKDGRLASGYWGGVRAHKLALESEGVEVKEYRVEFAKYRFTPERQ